MGLEFNGNTIATNANGYLENHEDWSEDLAKAMADAEDLELTDKHWDVLRFLRDEFVNNGGNQPNTRNIVKHCAGVWGEKISAKELYDLFPGDPSKQAGRLAGLPESRRKGGY